MEDKLGDVMKQYENVTRYYLPKKSYYILRSDGKAFHSLCHNMKKPYDLDFSAAMDAALLSLCQNVQGAIFGYVQSDECSIVFTDLMSSDAESWFGGNIQKIASVSASFATAAFNKARWMQYINSVMHGNTYFDGEDVYKLDQMPIGHFDSRVYSLSNLDDVYSYFEWRNLDCTRNAVSMAAHSMFSTKELHKKTSKEMQEMMFTEKHVNFNDYPQEFKSGRVCVKEYNSSPVTFTHKKTGEIQTVDAVRGEWVIKPSPIFTRPDGREWLESQISLTSTE